MILPSIKTCTRCGEYRTVEEFYVRSGRKLGYSSQCKHCAVKRVAEWREANPGKRSEQIIAWKHKLTPEVFNLKMEEQGGVCAICKKPSDTRLAVDHDHSCCPGNGKTCGNCLRGLLCRNCNVKLAFVEDTAWLKSALHYLTTYSNK